MGEIDDAPFGIVEFHSRRAARFAGFYQRAIADKFKIASGIGRMAECESPISIEG